MVVDARVVGSDGGRTVSEPVSAGGGGVVAVDVGGGGGGVVVRLVVLPGAGGGVPGGLDVDELDDVVVEGGASGEVVADPGPPTGVSPSLGGGRLVVVVGVGRGVDMLKICNHFSQSIY